MTDIEKCLANLSVLNRLNDYSIWFGFFLGLFLSFMILMLIEHKSKQVIKKES